MLLLLPGCRQQKEADLAVAPPPIPFGKPAPEPAIAWIRQNAVPFKTENPLADDSDLAAFGGLVGNARVVGLGEATHGTRQFFQMKHRLIKYLIQRKGFRTFLMEADGGASCAIDDYIHTGKGDPAQLIRDLRFWTWSTEEFFALVRWMHDYNQTARPDETISFRGIDMQDPLAASRQVVSYLAQVDPEAARSAESAYRCLGPLEDHAALEKYRTREYGDQLRCAAGIQAVHQGLSRHQALYERKAPSGYACTLWSAHLLEQNERLLKFPSIRDSLYGENVLALSDPSGGNGKVIVWAHNGHVANSLGAMGRRIKKELASDYFIVGLTFHGGSFRARALQPDGSTGPAVAIAAPPPRLDSYEAALHDAGLPRFILDLRPLREASAAQGWFAGLHPMWDIGGAYRGRSVSAVRLVEEYDSLVFFDRGDASTPLPKARQPS
ncbi:MAG: erythromycin esterase family protein [Candidatus Aminicenantales bacterium]